MKYLSLSLLSISILLISSHCDNEVVSPYGHLKLTVTYPEVVHEADTFYYIPVPGVGSEARLYDKDAHCLGYRDAMIDVAWIDGNPTGSLYVLKIDDRGEALFKDILAGEYYLVIYTRKWTRYSEKYIEVKGGDTLKLSKDFTASGSFDEGLEPWDYEIHPNEK
jgi:hypothetical protein